MSDDDELHLAVRARALDAIAKYTRGMDELGFIDSGMTVDAVAMNLIVVGEAAKRLSPELKAQVPAPWSKIVAMRHLLAHEDFGVDVGRLWQTASLNAPELRALVASWLEAR